MADSYAKKVEERVRRMRDVFPRNADGTYATDYMVEDAIRAYCEVSQDIEDLNAAIRKEGYTIVEVKNMNGDTKLVENPKVKSVHKLRAQKAALTTQLRRMLEKCVPEGEMDKFDEFLAQ